MFSIYLLPKEREMQQSYINSFKSYHVQHEGRMRAYSTDPHLNRHTQQAIRWRWTKSVVVPRARIAPAQASNNHRKAKVPIVGSSGLRLRLGPGLLQGSAPSLQLPTERDNERGRFIVRFPAICQRLNGPVTMPSSNMSGKRQKSASKQSV
jgi:hypothetical protein